MGVSALQADRFYRDVVEKGVVWTLRDSAGYPVPQTSNGRRTQPFWSSRARVEKIIGTVAAYEGFEPVELSLEAFLLTWLPELRRDGCLVGLNWSGPRASGFDAEPAAVRTCLRVASGVARKGLPRKVRCLQGWFRWTFRMRG